MDQTSTQTGFLQFTRAIAAKAADVSGRLLREKGASFGSLRRWSWDILPLLSPSTQTHDCSLHPLGNSARLASKGSWSELFLVELFQVSPNVCSCLVISELYLVIVKQNDASMWLTQSTLRGTNHVSHNTFEVPTYCLQICRVNIKIALVCFTTAKMFDLLSGIFIKYKNTKKKKTHKDHFLSQSVLF